ncbi:hypothetical protein ASG89_23300 [Paenibacillus sp. Soil766]|uniref:helix-turn-helix domain-containing protein n=1 Tax=Paenibacillus sp. Soil766 TaxID=1736404 RepID=UPI00070D79EA|nr:helix-turn-helix domain-containing protein [Paenibacillus sp. Soil766]KRF03371.1 hypothetical protein ASG89_23300 [Paenibacillus sp. Soil766]
MPSYNHNQLAAVFNKLRSKKGVTIGQISSKTGISYEILSRLEKGKEQLIAQSTVILLAQYFSVPIEELVGFSPVERYLVSDGRKIDLSDYSESELAEIENFMIFLRWRRSEEKKEKEFVDEKRSQIKMQNQNGKSIEELAARLDRYLGPNGIFRR